MTDPEIAALAQRVIAENRAAGRCLATVESCTGGMVAAALTDVPGSSEVFERGFVTYSNDAKVQSVGVSRDIIDSLGAVSEATVWAMAQGGIRHSNADVAVAISGIAGPGGGSEKKPVGMVVFARAIRGLDGPAVADVRQFGDLGRAEIRRQATLVALELLLP